MEKEHDMFWPRKSRICRTGAPGPVLSRVLYFVRRGQVVCFIICCCCMAAGPLGGYQLLPVDLDKNVTAALLNKVGDFNEVFSVCCFILGVLTCKFWPRGIILAL